MTTPTKHLEIFDEKHWSKMIKEFHWADEIMLNDIRQHLIQTVINVLEDTVANMEMSKDKIGWVKQLQPTEYCMAQAHNTGLQSQIDSLTTTLSAWKALL